MGERERRKRIRGGRGEFHFLWKNEGSVSFRSGLDKGERREDAVDSLGQELM